MSHRCALVAVVALWLSVTLPSRPAEATCNNPQEVHIVNDGALWISATYSAPTDTYNIKIENRLAAWFLVRESHPPFTTSNCWPPLLSNIQNRTLPTNRLPELIAPNGTIELSNVRLLVGDRFGICHVGLSDVGGLFSADNAKVFAVTTLDLVGLYFFGATISELFGDYGVLSILSLFTGSTLNTRNALANVITVFLDPGTTAAERASAMLALVAATLPAKAAVIDALRALGFTRVFSVGAKIFEALNVIAMLRNKAEFAVYAIKMARAYSTTSWGASSIEVVSGLPTGEAPPSGEIVLPDVDNQVVGNIVTVRGIASDDCSGVHHVNLTYSADNGASWHFVAQDTTAPYEFSGVNLAAIPDGTTVRLGWDVYDNAGLHANSPSGNRLVIKNEAALTAPPYDAEYVEDVNYADGSILGPSQPFTKTWRIKNTGSSAWSSSTTLQFAGGTNLSSMTSVPLPTLAPGQTGLVSVPMLAPSTPAIYRSTWRPSHAGTPFGTAVFALIEVRCATPGSGTCPLSDRCVNMGCATHSAPDEAVVFKTPMSGSGVFYARGGYKHAFPTSTCYHLFYDNFDDLACIANEFAASPELANGPDACTEGSFYRREGQNVIYRMESGMLRPLCGDWTSASFQARWNFPFQIAFLVDSAHFAGLTGAYPIDTGHGIYPPGVEKPECGDPGFQCGDHVDPDGICYGSLHCGGCGLGAECLAGACVAEPLVVAPGEITSPAADGTIPSGAVAISWTHGVSSNGSPTSSALFCSINGGPWEVRVGYGPQTSALVGGLIPGASVQCKLRTRLDTAWDTWVESAPATWSVSSATAAMTVISIAERPGSNPNGCDDLLVEAQIRNHGALPGIWEATAYLHPVLEDELSPDAVIAHLAQPVSLAPGAQGTYAFSITPPLALPLASVAWSVTVVVTDPAGLGPTGRATVDAFGHDAGPPRIDAFQVYGFAGSPVELVPGRPHSIQLAGSDDYALESWELAWRSDAAWTPIAGGPAYTSSCREQHGVWTNWTVPIGLPAGTLVEIRARYRDVAGNVTEQLRPARLRSDAAPSVTFRLPTAGEHHLAATTEAPRCVPIDAIVVPGVPIQSLTAGFTGPTHLPLNNTSTLPVPSDGHVTACLPAWFAGDAIEVYLQVRDTNGTLFTFFAGPITVDFAPPAPPFGPVELEVTQGPPPPAPVPATQGGLTTTEYIGLKADATTFTVHRNDHARWQDPDLGTQLDRYALRRLTFTLANLAPLSSTAIVDSFTEVDPTPADGFASFHVSDYDGWPYFFDVATLGGCAPSPGPCDYEARIRDVVGGGPGAWRVLATYPGRPEYQGPRLDDGSGAVLLPASAGRLLSVGDVAQNTTTLFRLSGASWSTVGTQDPALRAIAVAQGTLWGFRTSVDGGGNRQVDAIPIDPSTGATGAPVHLVAGAAAGYSWWFARDASTDTIVVVALDVGANRVRVARLQGGFWVEATPQPIAATWRGHALTFRYLSEVQAAGGRVRVVLSVAWSGGGGHVALAFQPGDPLDLEHAFEDDGNRTTALVPDGRLVKAFVCRWNFEERLCLQVGYAAPSDCWDGNPCTDDRWDPIAGSCALVPRVCPSNGDACDGPEVCDPATGACISDTGAVPACGDGAWCNGAEACVPGSGACAPGAPPVVDDGRACTIDSCDEALDVVRHVPDDTRCVASHCEVAVCAPSTASADGAGCVRTPVPVTPDALACTDDLCDPVSGAMIHPVRVGFCAIDGVCYADGAVDPSGCRRCAPNVRSTEWTPVDNGEMCDDGLYCTTGDICAAGLCIGATRNCGAAPLPCLALECDEADDECQLAVRPNGALCDDGDPCNGIAVCNGGACTPGAPAPIDDGLVCTDDICDPFLGTLHPNNAASCNADNDGCTLDDQCAGGGCVAGPRADCAAVDDQCNVGRCVSLGVGSFTCVRDPSPREGMSCDDGSQCSLGDHCAAGTCVGATHVECPPVDECHQVGSCIPESGSCTEPVPLDGTPCAGGTCVAGECVVDADAGAVDAGDDGGPGDAASPDAGVEPPVDGCGCSSRTSGLPSGMVVCLGALFALWRRRGRRAGAGATSTL